VGAALGSKATDVSYDDSDWPFVRVTLPPRAVSDAEFEEQLRRLSEYAARGGGFGFVVDTRDVPDPGAKRRRDIAEFVDELQRRHGAAFIGAAVVISSAKARAIFKAISWLRQGATPLIAVSSPDEGMQELRKLARKARGGH
jgi:hypothetical protein